VRKDGYIEIISFSPKREKVAEGQMREIFCFYISPHPTLSHKGRGKIKQTQILYQGSVEK